MAPGELMSRAAGDLTGAAAGAPSLSTTGEKRSREAGEAGEAGELRRESVRQESVRLSEYFAFRLLDELPAPEAPEPSVPDDPRGERESCVGECGRELFREGWGKLSAPGFEDKLLWGRGLWRPAGGWGWAWGAEGGPLGETLSTHHALVMSSGIILCHHSRTFLKLVGFFQLKRQPSAKRRARLNAHWRPFRRFWKRASTRSLSEWDPWK